MSSFPPPVSMGQVSEQMQRVHLEALRRQEARTVAEVAVRQQVYDAAERALANEKAYLELVRKDIALLSGGAR